jgi:hypothetical protein
MEAAFRYKNWIILLTLAYNMTKVPSHKRQKVDGSWTNAKIKKLIPRHETNANYADKRPEITKSIP